MTYLETQRLLLRNLSSTDMETIFAYRNHPDCAKYQRWDDTSKEAVAHLIENHHLDCFLSQKEEQHYGVYLKNGEFIGDISYFYNENDPCITLGITIVPDHQHKGYAKEILQEVITAIRHKYPNIDIVALIDPKNEPSLRLFQKLGFQEECYAASIASCVYVL